MPPMMLSKGITYVSNSVLTVRYRKMKENIALLSFKASHRSVRSAPSRRVYIWNPWWQVAEKLWNYIPIQKQMLCCSNLNCFSASGVKLGGWVFSWLLLVPWLMTRRMIPECITWTIRRVTKLKPSPSLCPSLPRVLCASPLFTKWLLSQVLYEQTFLFSRVSNTWKILPRNSF